MAVWSVNLVDPDNGELRTQAKIFAADEAALDHAVAQLSENSLKLTASDGRNEPEVVLVEHRFAVADIVRLVDEAAATDASKPNGSAGPTTAGPNAVGPDPKAADDSRDVDSIPPTDYASIVLNSDVSLIVLESTRNEAAKKANELDKLRYYFSPLFLVLKDEAEYVAVGERHTIRFPMFLFDESLRQRVVNLVFEREKIAIRPDQVSLLPINRIEILETLGDGPNLRYIYPMSTSPGSTRPILSPRHWVDMVFDAEAQARQFLARIKAGQASFTVNIAFSGASTTTDMAIIRIKQSDKTQMRNSLAGAGGAGTYVSRGQQMKVSREILNTMEQFVYQESSVRQEINLETVMRLIQDGTFPVKEVDLAQYNNDVWAKFSDFGFDKRDIAPDKITKIVKDIKECQTYEQANSRNVGGSVQASFLGFGGSASGNYQSQDEYKSSLEKAFRLEKEGEWYVPKAINVTQSLAIVTTADTVITSVSSVKRQGEASRAIQRDGRSSWTPSQPPPGPVLPPEIEVQVTPILEMRQIPDNTNTNNRTITFGNAKTMKLMFEIFDMEARYDFVIAYHDSKNGIVSRCYTGKVPAGTNFWTETFLSNTVTIRTVTDGTSQSPGWRMTKAKITL